MYNKVPQPGFIDLTERVMRRKHLARAVVLLFPLVCLAVLWPVRSAQSFQNSATFEKTVQPFFAENCYACHNSDLKTAKLDLESYKTADSILRDRDVLARILRKLSAGQMPPEGMPRPDRAATDAVIGWIKSQLGDRAAAPAATASAPSASATATTPAAPIAGRVTAHRLNRSEYNNTVRDLLGVDFHPADDFPQDDSGYGFDNIGDVLSLSPVLMEKYLAAAEKVARAAVFGPEKLQPTLVRLHPQQARLIPSTKPLFDYDQTGLTMPNALHASYRFPVDGEYVVRALLGGVRPAGSEGLHVALWIDGQQVRTAQFDPAAVARFEEDRQELYMLNQEFRLKVSAGEHWIAVSLPQLYEGLPASYAGPDPSTRPTPKPRDFVPPPDLPPEKVAEIKKRIESRRAEVLPANGARINALEIGGPYAQVAGPSPECLKRVYLCGHLDGHHKASCARKIVYGLARLAYRRPVTSQEGDQLVKLASSVQRDGESFEEGLAIAIEAMLVSPHFLFRIEHDPVPASASAPATGMQPTHQLSQYELASRLSYFLWSSMPDEELLAAADRGTLNQPAVLEAQVRRMLADNKSHALVENFGGQWLELRKLESAKPDRQRFPEFDEYLRLSMRQETELFFQNVIHQDRSILDFIDGNYTFLNERLAGFYHIPGVTGTEFRKVSLTPESQRSGVLTQASVLTVSSYATRTSPVLRGKWILANILDAPPPPPPPDVPNLDESKIGSAASLRDQLEQHRKNAVCASCHSRMDPLGFGLENFDGVGAWRTRDGKFPVDASGTLPDGRTFTGPRELEAIVKSNPKAFARCLTRKLLTYGLGRGLEPYDDPAVNKIVDDVVVNNYKFSSVVLGIARSLPFQMRTGETVP